MSDRDKVLGGGKKYPPPSREQDRNDGGSDVRGLVERLRARALWNGRDNILNQAADALSSLLERVAAAEERENELRLENAYFKAGLSLVAESRFPESVIVGYLPGQRVNHAVERWSLEPFCDTSGLLIVNRPFTDVVPGWTRCAKCVAALNPPVPPEAQP